MGIRRQYGGLRGGVFVCYPENRPPLAVLNWSTVGIVESIAAVACVAAEQHGAFDIGGAPVRLPASGARKTQCTLEAKAVGRLSAAIEGSSVASNVQYVVL